MKKFLTIVVLGLLCCNVGFASEFCNGFKNGYIEGFRSAQISNLFEKLKSKTKPDTFYGRKLTTPMCPMKPMKKMNDPESSNYEHGYEIGYEEGSRG